MDAITPLAASCHVASVHDIVLHTECCYSFQSPFHHGGLWVPLTTNFLGVSKPLQDGLYLHIVSERKLKEEAAPQKLALGVEGGFATEPYQIISTYAVVVVHNSQEVARVPYTEDTKPTFPEPVVQSVESVIYHAGWTTQQEVQTWQQEEDIPVSRYAANLPFVDNGVTISPHPNDWKCQKSGDQDNVWLNLSDGYMGGGRQHWDGSGGSNGALDHYTATGQQYPLVVKLGTITADTADCYSYAPDEDGPVLIPNLHELLAKRGIHMGALYVCHV